MEDLSILVVSYHFPPSAAVGGKRVARFCRYLPDFGIRPTVLTIDEESCEAIDTTFHIPERLAIERVRPVMTFLDWYRQMVAKGNGNSTIQKSLRWQSQSRKEKNLLKRHLLALLQFPDKNRGWYRPATRAANEVIHNSRIDAVLSSGPPWTTHAVAHSIARQHKLPWIADFRDAWVSDAWRKYALDSTGLPHWRDWLDSWVEERWLGNASLVVCTTDQHRNALLAMYPRVGAKHIVTVHNGFDDEHGKAEVTRSPSRAERLLLHAGDLYAGRRVASFCVALELLAQSGKVSPNNLKTIFLGDRDLQIEQDARCLAPNVFQSGLLEFRPRVSWKEAQQVLSEAAVLLIVQGDHPTAVPAKFFEYLRTGKPILALTKDGALRDLILRTSSGVVADPDDCTAIASAVEHVLAMPLRSAQEVESSIAPFHFRKLTADLAANIRRVVAP